MSPDHKINPTRGDTPQLPSAPVVSEQLVPLRTVAKIHRAEMAADAVGKSVRLDNKTARRHVFGKKPSVFPISIKANQDFYLSKQYRPPAGCL